MSNQIQSSARPLPAFKIGDSWLSYDRDKNEFYLDTPDEEYDLTDFEFFGGATTEQRFSTCLSFMAAAAEAQRSVDQGRFSDNADSFEPGVMRWCQENASEIGWLLCEFEGEEDESK